MASPAARRRILDTASSLFYADGVHTVGVDRIIAEAGVAKATFYKHFPAKDTLVAAYIDEQSAVQRTALDDAVARSRDGAAAVRRYFDYLCTAGSSAAYRGCPIANVTVEYPQEEHPVRRAIAEHRRWFLERFRALLGDAGHPHPQQGATVLMLLRDGVLVALALDAADRVRRAVRGQVDCVLSERRHRR